MMRGCKCVLLCLVLCALYSVPSFAGDWEVYVPAPPDTQVLYPVPAPAVTVDEGDRGWFDDVELINDLATGSDAVYAATPSSALPLDTPVVYGSYAPYDSPISSSVVAYMEDVLPRLGNVSYVLFRSGQYTYRLVYARSMDCADGVFTASDASYVAYDTRYYTWSNGAEGAFTLRAGDALVYSDAVGYPMLHSSSVYWWLMVFVAVVFFLFTIMRAMFAPHRMTV